jgi:hypothetical protein
MLRFTFVTREVPLYHRRALSLAKGAKWHGNFGAVAHRFYGKTCMTEAVTPKRTIAAIDRDMMTYVHRLKIRHRQLRRSYSEKPPSMQRQMEKKQVHARAWTRKVHLAYKAYMQFATMRTLREQARLVTVFGQAAVNEALGDVRGERDRQRLVSTLHRAVRQPPVVQPVRKHVVTRYQKHNDRFDLTWRQNGN